MGAREIFFSGLGDMQSLVTAGGPGTPLGGGWGGAGKNQSPEIPEKPGGRGGGEIKLFPFPGGGGIVLFFFLGDKVFFFFHLQKTRFGALLTRKFARGKKNHRGKNFIIWPIL